MSPAGYLLLCLLVMGVALTIERIDAVRRQRRLRRLAGESGMYFAAQDRFNLAGRIAQGFPVVGAARPKVADVLYGRRGERYYYVMRFEYTVGAASRQKRRRAIVGYAEPRQRATPEPSGPTHPPAHRVTDPALRVADPALPILEQYRSMIAQTLPETDPAEPLAPITLVVSSDEGEKKR